MSEKYETVESFSSEFQAGLAKTRLEAAGIQATFNRYNRYRSMAGGGWQVRVAPKDLAHARKILQRLNLGEVDMDEYVDEADTSYRRCPQCNSVNLNVKPLTRSQLRHALLTLGIALLWTQRSYTCAKCGHHWLK
jgi:DNA-directed RNA polymerase subunit RPC12/RpoP